MKPTMSAESGGKCKKKKRRKEKTRLAQPTSQPTIGTPALALARLPSLKQRRSHRPIARLSLPQSPFALSLPVDTAAAASGGRRAPSRAATAAARRGLFPLPHFLLLLFS
jgi:hypothetical protein